MSKCLALFCRSTLEKGSQKKSSPLTHPFVLLLPFRDPLADLNGFAFRFAFVVVRISTLCWTSSKIPCNGSSDTRAWYKDPRDPGRVEPGDGLVRLGKIGFCKLTFFQC